MCQLDLRLPRDECMKDMSKRIMVCSVRQFSGYDITFSLIISLAGVFGMKQW